MAAVVTATVATATVAALDKMRKRVKYEGGVMGVNAPNVANIDLVLADYIRMRAAVVLVKADGAYASLDAATKTAVDAVIV